ncbi:MAG: polysaccharide pyruvyl transferase family protein [Erysipelotrichia bacterium]|nr:polysaccharide pyruvyl transferase family protein [Erysipelotrichia bacterium]
MTLFVIVGNELALSNMKYGIITHYDVHNHGAFLQLNGLIKVLKRDFNIDAQALQFDKNYDFAETGVKEKHLLGIKSIGFFMDYIWNRGLGLFIFNIKKRGLFLNFINNENLMGPRSDQSEEIDGVIVGSDEVFALHTGLTPEFFGYKLPSKKVFSYAGCFGPTTIEEVRRLKCEKIIGDGLSSMIGLSMRDQNSIAVAKELTGRESELVCDPVILYGYKEELAKHTNPNLPRYLLVYAYESRLNEPNEYQPIIDYAHKNGLIVVCPGFYHKWADKNINADPVELLRYFKYADCVITDTFHGCVMSIILGKEMAVKARKGTANLDNANKLLNLMDEYCIADRRIGDEWNLDDIFSKKVNWEATNKQIESRRSASLDYLKRMIAKGV